MVKQRTAATSQKRHNLEPSGSSIPGTATKTVAVKLQKKLQRQVERSLTHDPLKLRATSPEDLLVVSSLLQDALVDPRNCHYDAHTQTFTMTLNRFCWEDTPERFNHHKVYGRVQTCLRITNVCRVQSQNFQRNTALLGNSPDHQAPLTLLTLSLKAPTANSTTTHPEEQTLIATFSTNVALKFTLTSVRIFIEDDTALTYTVLKPEHVTAR